VDARRTAVLLESFHIMGECTFQERSLYHESMVVLYRNFGEFSLTYSAHLDILSLLNELIQAMGTPRAVEQRSKDQS